MNDKFKDIIASINTVVGHANVVITDMLTTDALTSTTVEGKAGGFVYSVKDKNGIPLYTVTAADNTEDPDHPVVTFHVPNPETNGTDDYPATEKTKDGRTYYEAEIDENTKYELLQRLQGMKNHNKLCHGDFHPSNVIVTEDQSIYVIDWAHVTQGNASADAARTYLLFSIDKKESLAEKYINLFAEKSGIEKSHIQRWIPIVAATQMTKNNPEEQEFLSKWINVMDYE